MDLHNLTQTEINALNRPKIMPPTGTYEAVLLTSIPMAKRSNARIFYFLFYAQENNQRRPFLAGKSYNTGHDKCQRLQELYWMLRQEPLQPAKIIMPAELYGCSCKIEVVIETSDRVGRFLKAETVLPTDKIKG